MKELLTDFQEWLSNQIELYDRMTETDFLIDSQIYNENAMLLRKVRDELKSRIKLYKEKEF